MEKSRDEAQFKGSQFVLGEKEGSAAYDAKFLISVLLVYVAKGDGSIDSTETDRMIDIISRRFDSTGAEAMGLLADAVRTFTDGGDLARKLHEISQGLDEAERNEIFEMLFEVIMADGKFADGEARTVEGAGKILGLSQDAIHALIRSKREG
jgi:uncharacterized tellurite resistance protein B-like protein